MELPLKDGENGTGRVARLKLSDEGMCTKVILRALLVCVQSVVDDQLEVGGLVVGRGSRRVGMRHGGERKLFVCIREDDWELVGDRAEGKFTGRNPGIVFPGSCITSMSDP